MVNPSTESILNQMTNLAMDIAMDYVLPASPMSDVCKSDLYEFEREVVAAASSSVNLLSSLVASTVGTANGCCGRPPTNLCKKNSYMGAAGCDSCDACTARHAADSTPGRSCSGSPSSAGSYTPSSTSSSPSAHQTPPQQQQQQPPQTAETTMDISWCQFDGCEFDTADNSYLDICEWIFYADRYALTDENREKVQKAFQMVPPGEVTGYVAGPPPSVALPQQQQKNARMGVSSTITTNAGGSVTIKSEPLHIKSELLDIKSEPEDDYLWTSDNHLQPIILKAKPNADILEITELDHSYLQSNSCSASSSAAASPIKHHHHANHLVDMLGLVTPPPSRSQSSEEEEIDVVNDGWDTPDTPRKGATMADIMKRGIVKKRDQPVTKWKNTVKRKHKTTAATVAAAYPMPPPPPKKLCGGGGLSLLDRFKKDTNWKDMVIKDEPLDEEPVDELSAVEHAILRAEIKAEPLDGDDEDDDYDMDADFESLMKNEPEDIFDDEYDDYDDENDDMDWDKVLGKNIGLDTSSSPNGGSRGHSKSSGGSSSCSSSSHTTAGGRKKKKKKKATKMSKQQQQLHSSSGCSGIGSGKRTKYDGGTGTYSYKTKLMDPVKRALHNDLEKSRRVETSMLFMNLSEQVSFLDDNRKIPSKLSILRGAKRECDLMMLDERRLLSEKHVMQQKQRMLRERLFELRRDHYHRRYGKNNPKQQQQQQQHQQQQQQH
ncbi:uncharacterized protein LOC112687885 [Sipha flava]|uniref:Uncharacterized protein LOC112687885 n=4 Tax=Sipha flava TaxID=143950 RepID=A0A8B8G0U7_9HEMI|nr:uncharacterized protein LOC112687885 [Sipha flava]